jgi:hypothetical protein
VFGVLSGAILLGAHFAPRVAAAASYAGVLFDGHAHTTSDVSTQSVFDAMRRNNVIGIFLYGPSTTTPVLQRSNPDLVNPYAQVPYTQVGAAYQLTFDSNTVAFIETQLRTGVMRGIGEIPMRHESSFTATYQGYPADGAIALDIYRLAAQYRIPINIHQEHEYQTEFENAVRLSPNTVFVWAHAGDSVPSSVGDVMRRYANVWVDISTRNPYMKLAKRNIPMTDGNGIVLSDWAAFFREFADRITFGLDVNDAERAGLLDQTVTYYRSVLGQLDTATAEKVAYKNAARLLEYASSSFCSYAVSPGTASISSASGSGATSVTTTAGCGWTATSNASFITISAGTAGNGSGTVSYSVTANGTGASRSGTMTIAGQTFTVTQAAATPLGAPTNLTASAAGSTVTLTWGAPTTGTPTAYLIEAGSGTGLANLANFSTGGTATSFSASSVAAGLYYLRARATDGVQTSVPSNEATLTVGSCAPSAPSGLAISSNAGRTVVLRWTGSTGSPTSYLVEAGSAPGLANLANVDVGVTTSLTAGGVAPGAYYVRVRARNSCGTSGPSNEIQLTVN